MVYYFFIFCLSQPLNQWALLSTRLFRQPNYWWSASYTTCLPHMWTFMILWMYLRMPVCNACCVSVLSPAGYRATYSSGGDEPSTSIAKHQEERTLTTRLRRQHACLQCMLRQRFIPGWLQGNLQLRRKRTINKHCKALRGKHTDYSATEAACLSAMHAASAFYPGWLQGYLQLRRRRTINKHCKASRGNHTDHSATSANGQQAHSLLLGIRECTHKLYVSQYMPKCVHTHTIIHSLMYFYAVSTSYDIQYNTSQQR